MWFTTRTRFSLFKGLLNACSSSFPLMHTAVHEFVWIMVDHRRHNDVAFKDILNPPGFANITNATKYIKSAGNCIPLAPLVHGFTSEPKYHKTRLVSIVNQCFCNIILFSSNCAISEKCVKITWHKHVYRCGQRTRGGTCIVSWVWNICLLNR